MHGSPNNYEQRGEQLAASNPTVQLKAAVGWWVKGDYARAAGYVRAAERIAQRVQLPEEENR